MSQPLQAAIVAEAGLAQAYYVQDMQDRRQALKMIDTAGKIIHANDFERDWYFLQVNEEWYTIDKAEAYNAVNWPRSALDEIAHIHKSVGQRRRRYVYANIIEAEANIASGHLEMGLTGIDEALDVVENMRSITFLARITNIYGKLKQDQKYSRSPDVARLGVKLLKVQHPEIFV